MPTKDIISLFINNVSYSERELEIIESQTVGQNMNPTWTAMRKGIITASKFKRVTSRVTTLLKNPTADPCTTIDEIIGNLSGPPEDLPALQWGRKSEAKAS